MTVNTDIFKRAGVDEETDERARRAVKAFRAMQPTLSAYARVLTKRKDVRVEMAARDNGSTDGRRIFYRPPIALGDKTPHDRQLCDKRDEVKQLLCPACAIRESVLVTIYHEIAHIAFDSFARPSDADRKRAIEGAIKEAGGRWSKEIAAKIEALPPYRKDSYMGLASCINEYFPYLVNCLEDARVNRELFKARQGVRKMFDADTWKIFTEGVEQKDASGNIIVVPWNQYPLNTQVMVGTFCKASGYDYSNWFHPRVVEALNDEELTRLIGRMDTVRSAGAVYHLAFLVMARLRDLGFLGTPTDPDPEPKESDESQDADQPEGEGESPDSDSIPEQSSEESSSGDEPDTGEGEGAGDSPEADGDSASGDSEEGEEDSGAGSDQEDSGGGSTDSEGAGPSEDSDSDDQSTEGQEESASDSTSGGQEATDGDDEQSGQGSSSSADEGDSVDDDVSEGESDSDSVPDSDAAGDGTSDDGSQGGESGHAASPSGEEDDTDSAESGEGLRGTGDISASSDGGTPEEASTEPDFGSDSGGRRGGGETQLEESMEDASEPESTEDGSDVASTDENGDLSEGDDSQEVIDTGADDGYGGTEIRESEDVKPDPPMGTPDEVEPALLKWGDHEEKPKSVDAEAAEDAVDRAIVQGIYFTTPSRNIFGVREHRYGSPIVISGYNMSNAWDHRAYLGSGFTAHELGITGDFTAPESILGEALMRMRVAFSDNQRGKELRHRKTGKIDAKVLGKRAHFKDERLFKKRILPGKKDYFVLIGIDVSGSTIGKNISLEKRAVMAQATLLDRLGVNFAIYAHSGNYHNPLAAGRKFDLDIYMVKEPQEVWDSNTKERLTKLGPDSANLDGHTLEYYRKVLDNRRETDRIILYYTDGKMPAENEREELEILQREIRICKQKNYTLLGVGIRTDSPIRHGLDTVQVDDDGDVVKVVKHLEKRLLGK